MNIAVSACLLGQKVRYDGREKKHSVIIDFFSQYCSDTITLVPFCPEVDIGLSVPRAKIHLVDTKKMVRVVGVSDPTLDVTAGLQQYAHNFLLKHPDIQYYIVKSKSPSCGYQSTPISTSFTSDRLTSGLFVQILKQIKTDLVFIEESQLTSVEACLALIKIKS